jgi:hypothetical protein
LGDQTAASAVHLENALNPLGAVKPRPVQLRPSLKNVQESGEWRAGRGGSAQEGLVGRTENPEKQQ